MQRIKESDVVTALKWGANAKGIFKPIKDGYHLFIQFDGFDPLLFHTARGQARTFKSIDTIETVCFRMGIKHITSSEA